MKVLVSHNCNLLSSRQFVIYCLRVCYMCYMTVLSCFCFFFFFFSLYFFLSCFFFLCCLLMFTRFQFFFPFVLKISFFFLFFFKKFFLWLFFYLLDLCTITTFFFELNQYFTYLGSFNTIFILFCNQKCHAF